METIVRRIGLVTHDTVKKDMIEWVLRSSERLIGHRFYCAGITGTLIKRALEEKHPEIKWDIAILKSGLLGGDQQIDSRIVEGEIDYLFFFTGPMTLQPHGTDVKALTRLAGVGNIVFCCNRSTADHIITSPLFIDSTYERIRPDYASYTQRFENKGIISETVEQMKKRGNKSENNISKWTTIGSRIFIGLSKKQVVYIFQNRYQLNSNLLNLCQNVGINSLIFYSSAMLSFGYAAFFRDSGFFRLASFPLSTQPSQPEHEEFQISHSSKLASKSFGFSIERLRRNICQSFFKTLGEIPRDTESQLTRNTFSMNQLTNFIGFTEYPLVRTAVHNSFYSAFRYMAYKLSIIPSARPVTGTWICSALTIPAIIRNISAAGAITSARSVFRLNPSARCYTGAMSNHFSGWYEFEVST